MALISLGTNTSVLAAQRELGNASSALAQSYERLSSGLRINQASDDAAGLAVAAQLESKARVYTQAVRNINDGLSAAHIAEGALGALKQISERQLELSEEAANGTYSTTQRLALNKEANALTDEFNRIVGSTTFNGINLFDPSLPSVVIQAGYGQTGTLQLGFTDQLRRAVGDGTYQVGSGTQTGAAPAIVTGDFNGDGILDLAAEGEGNTATVSLGNGDGTFKTSATLTTGGFVNSAFAELTVADVNGDGVSDIITANYENASVTVFIGNGNGTFKSAKTVAGVGLATSVQATDLNGDGKADLIVGTDSGQVLTLLGNGDGTFQSARTFNVAGQNLSIAGGDFNGDGRFDIVVAGYVSGTNTVLFGNGDGTFGAGGTFAVGGEPASVAVGDFNGDGYLDFVSANYSNGLDTVLLGNGNGTFKAAITLAGGTNPYKVVVGDLNGDGLLDIATADYFGAIKTFIGNGDGTFKAENATAPTNSATDLALGDFNSDGRMDIATASGAGDGSILLANQAFTSNAAYLNIYTQQGARNALNTVTANLNRIDAQLGALGAVTSRFAVAANVLQVGAENFKAAESRLQDVDVADESSRLVRTQILQQAAASVLGHANQDRQLVLRLLGD